LHPARRVYTYGMNANDLADDLKSQTKDVLQKAGDQLSEQASHLQDLASDARYHTEDFIQTNPWVAVSIAAGVGFVFGVLVARR
jgi:ElaB/YqjD/DUF883 family membrane-anchored ribosome-binding protein